VLCKKCASPGICAAHVFWAPDAVFKPPLWHNRAVVPDYPVTSSRARDPAWRPAATYNSGQLAAPVRRWLLDEGSLTAHLIRASAGDFRVRRIRQGWEQPLLSESRLLDLPARQQALVREVALVCEGEAWVFARSVIPASSLTGSLRHLRRLNNESLGALIFQHPSLVRSTFELALVKGNAAYIDTAYQQQQPAWGRRSRFEVQGKPLLVSEVFLQSFRPWPAQG
jgi:chorismate--pyruvate lyase